MDAVFMSLGLLALAIFQFNQYSRIEVLESKVSTLKGLVSRHDGAIDRISRAVANLEDNQTFEGLN